MLNIGKNMVEGIWNGIKNAKDWVLDKIRGFGKSIVDGIKNIFGIHSPSTVFRDQIGNNLALGIGEGFSNTMKDVSSDMANAIPTDLETNMALSSAMKKIDTKSRTDTDYDSVVFSFKEALKEMKIQLNDREVGNFVDTKLAEVVY